MSRKGGSKRRRRQNRRERARRAGRAAVDAAPAVAGGGAGLAAAPLGPAGGLVGIGASTTAKRLLRFVHLDRAFLSASERFGERERQRGEIAFNAAIGGIIERLDAGDGLRGDGFFSPKHTDDDLPSDAEQILEGVIRAACESHEERKAQRLGELYRFLAFAPGISAAHANYLVQLARRLTHQQLLLLGLFAIEHKDMPDWSPTGMFTQAEIGLTMAIYDLAREGLLLRRDHALIQGFADINPSQMDTVLNGVILVEAMELDKAEPDDLEAMADALRRLDKIDVDENGGTSRIQAIALPGSPAGGHRVPMDKQIVQFVGPAIRLEDLPAAE